jgi:lipopolysaccharide transport protein LptA
MKLLPLPFLLGVVLLMAWTASPAQTTDDATSDTPPPPPGATVITSDELHSDQQSHVSIFTGNVVVVGNQFRMTCQEMTVNFTKDNKVDTIVATGDVIINQPDRVTHCGRADYFRDEDKFVLTDQPIIHDHDNTISGPKIIIYRTSQKMEIEGRSTTVIGKDSLGATPTPQPSTTTQ